MRITPRKHIKRYTCTHPCTHTGTHIGTHAHTEGRGFKELSKGESQLKSCVFSIAWFVLIFLEQRDQY